MDRVSVAIVEGVVPSYHVPFLARLSAIESLDVTCFHGTGKRGHSVASVGPDLPVRSVSIHNVHWPGGGARIAWQTGLLPILMGRFGVIVCAESVHNLSTWLVLLFRRVGGYAVVLSGHGLGTISPGGLFNRIRLRLRRLLARSADVLLIYTEAGAAGCIEHGLDPGRIFISGNTLDTEALIAIAQSARLSCADDETPGVPAPTNQPVQIELLYVGRLYAAKRVDILLRAVRILAERGIRCRTLIVGEGHQISELKRMAASEDVVFAGACYDDRQLARYFAEADLLVIPDSVGLVAVHAFCNGIPVMTSGCGTGHGPEFDYIVDGRNGVLIDSLSPEAFADAIEALAHDRQKLDRMSAAAVDTARCLSMTAMASQFVRAMQFAAGRKVESAR